MSQLVGFYEIESPVVPERLGAIAQVEVDHLRPGPRLRVGGIKPDHLDVLVQSGGNWPPIVVRREDNTIIDGCYRYLAAQRLGHSHMDCIYYDGGSDDAFIEALRRNLHHGLPLSLKERENQRPERSWLFTRNGRIADLAKRVACRQARLDSCEVPSGVHLTKMVT